MADDSVVTTYGYDAADHIVSVTDPRGLVTSYTYDGFGNRWSVVSPDSGTTNYAYDSFGRLSGFVRANAVQTTFGYDAISRVTSVAAGGQTQSFAYDACTNGLGRLCSASDVTGATSYAYTPEGWISGRGFSVDGTVYALGYSYDSMGNVAVVNYPDGKQAVYSYNYGAVSSVALNSGGTQAIVASGVTWTPGNDQLASWLSGNGVSNGMAYDTDGRLTAVSASGALNLAFSYDAANRLVGIVNGFDPASSESLGYGAQSRLLSVYTNQVSAAYSYDANGNRITSLENGGSSTLTYGANSNQLATSSGAVAQTYGFDELGNITTLGGSVIYGYNPFNRLVTAGSTAAYVSPEGQRLRKTSPLGSTYFAPDTGGTLLAEADNGVWVDYIWLGGRIIARATDGQLEAVHGDELGRPQVVTNAAGAAVWSAQNTPFSRTVVLSNTSPLNIGLPGQYFDQETGLWNNGARDYDPNVGRYIQSDPIGLAGGINTYAYAGGDPLSNSDPLGLDFYGKSLAQAYLCAFGQAAWDRIRQDRNKAQGAVVPGQRSEALRNAEHYLWARQEVTANAYQWGPMIAATVGYHTTKFYANAGGGQWPFGASPYRGSPVTPDELEAGIEGANDGLFGGTPSCNCAKN
ncbi:RHS repeat-associated core domain-containing protein [Pinirhizobacter soli]|uniref:RHS repeat-associated core domain-containing protein n=1 Tax=Pinirhizobacter soli TaxID=2786953 RepID=UPI00202AB3CF|nr:RHS repeat-associated core domain-containing protein [Pinirhizobacter soli]